MTKFEIFGRVESIINPAKAEEVLSLFQRMANDPKYVEYIFNDIQLVYADESEEKKRDYLIGTIYQIYQPLSFLHDDGKAAGKLPPGVRDELGRLLGFKNSEMCNHYKKFIDPLMKPFNNGVERPFKAKVMYIVDRFKPMSINKSHSQYKMELA